MHTDFLEQPAAHHAHHAAALIGAIRAFRALPWRALEFPRRAWIKRVRCLVFERFERSHDAVAQGFEPASCACFLGVEIGHGNAGNLSAPSFGRQHGGYIDKLIWARPFVSMPDVRIGYSP